VAAGDAEFGWLPDGVADLLGDHAGVAGLLTSIAPPSVYALSFWRTMSPCRLS